MDNRSVTFEFGCAGCLTLLLVVAVVWCLAVYTGFHIAAWFLG